MKSFLAFWSACLFVVAAAHAVTTEPPNIILVMADDQGWGDMGYNGHPDLKTPNFDALAKEGIRFDQFHAAAPVCSPTRGSVLTGRTPNRFGCFSWGYPIRPQETTVAAALKTAGYRTGHFGKWHLGSVQKDSPVNPGACGFDEWVSSPNFFDQDPVFSDQGTAVQMKGGSSDVTVDVALKFIRKCAADKQRFLAVVWFGSPHAPHEALKEDRAPYKKQKKGLQNFYGEITAMDRAFGRLRSELRELELRENTLVWFCSDNGALPKLGSAGGRRGSKGDLYEGGLLVPALLEWPALFKEPQIVSIPCGTTDIYPTLMEIAEVELKKQPPLDGISLLPILEGEAKKRAKPMGFWDIGAKGIEVSSKKWMGDLLKAQAKGKEPDAPERVLADAGQIGEKVSTSQFPGHAAWLDWPWKIHRLENPKTHEVSWELFDLSADPNETRVLYAEQPERVPAMQGQLESWLESVTRSLNGEDY